MQFLRVFGCSYEGSLFGWRVVENKKNTGFDSSLDYGFHCAPGSLKTIAVSDMCKYLACGGMDDKIRVFNAIENKSLGELSLHGGAITSLKFVGNNFLLSASEDSKICIWRVHDWSCIHIMEGHEGPVNCICAHPSGKLALSCGKDKTLRMWNLVQGRCSFTKKLKEECFSISFDRRGKWYFLLYHRSLEIYQVNNNLLLASISCSSRINAASFSRANVCFDKEGSSDRVDDCIAVACDNKTIVFYQIDGNKLGEISMTFVDGGRIRDIVSLPPNREGSSSTTMQELLEEEGDVLALVTSLGSMAVLSVHAAVQWILKNGSLDATATATATATAATATAAASASSSSKNVVDSNSEEDSLPVESCLFVVHPLTVEPRLTAVAAWSPSLDEERQLYCAPSDSSLVASSSVSSASSTSSLTNSSEKTEHAMKPEQKAENQVVSHAQKNSSKNNNNNNNSSNKSNKSNNNKSSNNSNQEDKNITMDQRSNDMHKMKASSPSSSVQIKNSKKRKLSSSTSSSKDSMPSSSKVRFQE